MFCEKCLKIQDKSVDSSDDNFADGGSGDGASSGGEHDDNNCMEFAAEKVVL